MTVFANISVSADGYMAGPDQSVDNPMGVGAMGIHEWTIKLRAWREGHGLEGGEVNASTEVAEAGVQNAGASVMGRNMFGGGPGGWGDGSWTGWWGDEPPFHHPVFVLTHHPREPLEMQGGTTFHFVTDGVESAISQAKAAAGERDVSVGGGAQTLQQVIAAGLLDEIWITTAPLLLGSGERLLDGVAQAGARFEQVHSIAGPDAIHAKYRVTYS